MANTGSTTHGMSGTPTHRAWKSMKERCLNKRSKSYPYWGGRGIGICDRWLGSFESFLSDMGIRPPGMELDRYPDNDGNYEPTNCRWATRVEQRNNRREPKLNRDLVQEIRGRIEHGEPLISVARRMDVSRSMISLIRSGKRWAESRVS